MKRFFATVIMSLGLACGWSVAQNVVTQPDGKCGYVPLTARQRTQAKASAVAEAEDATRAEAQAIAVKAALARLKKSAATNQDIADVLTLLRAVNAQLNP